MSVFNSWDSQIKVMKSAVHPSNSWASCMKILAWDPFTACRNEWVKSQYSCTIRKDANITQLCYFCFNMFNWNVYILVCATRNIEIKDIFNKHQYRKRYLDWSSSTRSLSLITKIASSFPMLAISFKPTPPTLTNAENRSLLIQRSSSFSNFSSSVVSDAKEPHHSTK